MLWRRSIAQTKLLRELILEGLTTHTCPEKQNNGSEKPYSKLNKKA